MGQLFADAARAYLSAGIAAGDTTISISSGGALFPVANGTDWFKAVLQDAAGIEIVYVTAHTSGASSFTVTRGQEGTTARSFAAESVFGLRVTAADTAAFAGKLGDAPSDGKTYGRKDAAWEEVTGGGIAEVATPTNITPVDAATNITDETPELTASAFFSLYSATHSDTQLQVSTATDFSSLIYDTGSISPAIAVTIPAATLSISTTYYWRIRYKNSRGIWSDWSVPTSFATGAAFDSFISTPAATPGAFGDAFEGGFYTGMIWNELVQSSTSATIGTGSKSFAVPSMVGAPIVYLGQTLEVRSRANPGNKMVGVVTGAGGTTLALNITSTGGSGTFADWSIMSRYRVIVAPKSSGENASINVKNANTALPTACITISEGRKATLAMVAADTSTVYPAAHWCNNLSIGGKTDWYLPARDEAELWCRNLKPSASNNYTASDRPVSGSSYATFGSPGDTSTDNGNNGSSAPSSPGNTLTVPGQVSAGKGFRTGESEAFAAVIYRTCTEHSTTQIALQYFEAGGISRQNVASKTSPGYIRAVRRSII